jgi:(S)-mandelate dehydrogenase
MSLHSDSDTPPRRMHPPDASGLCRGALRRARSIADLREQARRRLPRGVFDFMDGAAEDEVTLRENRAAFERIRFLPKVLVDVAKPDTSIDLLGRRSLLPFAIGPTGAAGFLWPRGDLAIAAAAHKAGIPFALSTSASVSIEDMAKSATGPLWFQCYIFKQRDFTDALIARALAADYEALIITVDFAVGGNRERDFRNDFAVPFRYTPRNFTDFALHPRWATTMLRWGAPRLENLRGFVASTTAAAAASSVGRNYDASFTWDDLARIRDCWPRKLIVKGIVRPDDAERLAAMGCDAIGVSNHGGRQLDGTVATLDALPGVARAVSGRAAVFVDGGVRRGSDIVKALALGADAVLIGRATLYGVAAAGQHGAAHALSILRAEFERCMQLCGATRISEIGPDLLAGAHTMNGTSREEEQ